MLMQMLEPITPPTPPTMSDEPLPGDDLPPLPVNDPPPNDLPSEPALMEMRVGSQ